MASIRSAAEKLPYRSYVSGRSLREVYPYRSQLDILKALTKITEEIQDEGREATAPEGTVRV